MRNLAETLRIDSDVVVAEAPLAGYVAESVGQILTSWGQSESLAIPRALYEAIQACDWIPEPTATLLKLRMQARTNQIEDEPSLDAVIETIGANSSSAVAIADAWLQARNPDADQLANLTLTMRNHNAWENVDFCNGLRRKTRELAQASRVQLLERLLTDRFTLPATLLAACDWEGLDDERAVDLLLSRMGAAKNNPERSQVLSMAKRRSYSSRTGRSRFVAELIIPQLSNGVEATSNALDALAAFGKPFPREMRGPMVAAIRPAIEGNDKLTAKATAVLTNFNFPTRGKGPFGLGGRTLKLD